jgi:hypothetical protein
MNGRYAPPWQLLRWPQLVLDAAPVPPGLRPRVDVSIGCGNPNCWECYEPDTDPKGRSDYQSPDAVLRSLLTAPTRKAVPLTSDMLGLRVVVTGDPAFLRGVAWPGVPDGATGMLTRYRRNAGGYMRAADGPLWAVAFEHAPEELHFLTNVLPSWLVVEFAPEQVIRVRPCLMPDLDD